MSMNERQNKNGMCPMAHTVLLFIALFVKFFKIFLGFNSTYTT